MNNLRQPAATSRNHIFSSSTGHPLNNDIHHRSDQCTCQNCKSKINENQIMSICLNCSLSSQQTAYTLCLNCKKEQGKHHQKKGHCFALVLNRKFKYPLLERIGLLDKKISKNGVLVADQYCKDYELFTKPIDSFNLEQVQIVQGKIVHKGVTCDGCECSIHGTRFHCLNCRDFDLCSTCMKNHIRKTTGSMLNVSTMSVTSGTDSSTTNNSSFSHPSDHVFLQSALPIMKRPRRIAESIYVDNFNDILPDQTNQLDVNHVNNSPSNSIDIRPTEKTADILIYPFSDQTFEALYDIECSCFSKPLDKKYLYQAFKQSLCNNHEKPVDNFTWVACTRNNTNIFGSLIVAGYITYNINKEKQRCEITSFAVHPDLRKNGIGQELLRFTIQHVLTYSWMWRSMNDEVQSSQYSITPTTNACNLDTSETTYYVSSLNSNEHVIVNVDQIADTEEEECKYWNNYPTMQSGFVQYWKKCLWIQLHVSSFNLPAQRLYTKFGFKATTFLDDYYHSEINIAKSQQQASDQGDGVLMILSVNQNQFIL
ncbi:predicted protein [Naegleria gruberi]|uniref:Predicted protein n=1 Tax=Naegleria gruberi TaxID=5762 RepID=D2VLR4_NAEGR|nr:uncharacterized protein NAEGRDRAFT_69872 [Naegleria gruberi]EFC42186.1 predicted protein [Naegleria gruberi]|eukprot:XP_002674930.1 predicted protein [Naegleria gruberi strain NEG-M]